MSVTELTRELKQMSNADRLLVIEAATKLVRDEIKGEKKSPQKLSLRESAKLMRDEYLNNRELTIITDSLAHEDFYDA